MQSYILTLPLKYNTHSAGKPEGKRPIGRSRRRWEDNIRIDIKEIWEGVDLVDLAQDWEKRGAVVNTVMNLLVP
jgi:hypothetical protein